MALYCQITGRDGQITDSPTVSAPSSARQCLGSCLHRHVCVITFCCSGDLSSVRVDLEQGDVVFVGDLADQVVGQMSVGGRWVVVIQRKHAGKWDTWNNRKN